MIMKFAGISGLAALSLMLAVPSAARAQSWSQDGVNSQSQHNKNLPLVGTRGAILNTVDAKKAKQGEEFKVKLADSAKLQDGQVYPKGTVLIGKVTKDDMNEQGKTKLALCIDQAKTKDGKTQAIQAYIVGLAPANGGNGEQATAVTPGNQAPNPWKRGITQVDEKNALNGVDLHSKVGDGNSAVLVSNHDDIKLKYGTELALVIGESNGNGNGSSGQAQGSSGGR